MAKVLLIDDDSELTTLLSEYLVEEGFQVETSEDARVGIASAADQSVDIIVLDVMMPRMNGIDALQRIRRLALQLHISINSESMGLHDSEVMDDGCINRDDAGTLGIVAA